MSAGRWVRAVVLALALMAGAWLFFDPLRAVANKLA